MTYAQLGPPVAVASRGGSSPTGGAGGDIAMAARSEADAGGFTAALESRRTPASSDARPAEAHTPKDAAGPRTGELHEEVAADVGASQETESTTAVAAATAALAVAIATVIPTVVSPTPPAAGALVAQQVVEVAELAGPPQPIAGLVPARLDGNGGVAPAAIATTTPVAAPAAPAPAAPAPVVPAPVVPVAPSAAVPVVAAPAPVVAAAVTTTAQTDATATAGAAAAAPAPLGAPTPAGPTTAPAATLTLTIGTTPSGGRSGAGLEQDAQAGVPAGQAAIPASTTDKAVPAQMRPQVQDAAPAAATGPAAPAGSIAPAPVQPLTQADPLAGIVRSGGGLTTPHELARELGTRVHMAVREGGRELVLNLRPADLGHLTIRVTMNDGIMQAQIMADRPEAARMLQQSMGHLESALGDLGYSLDNLDVAYQGQDSHDAQASSQGEADGALSGEVLEADGSPAVPGPPTSTGTGAPGRLDILA